MEFLKWIERHKETHAIRDPHGGIVYVSSINNVEMAAWLFKPFWGTEWYELDDQKDYVLDLKMVQWLDQRFDWEAQVNASLKAKYDWHHFDNYSSGEDEFGGDSNHKRWVNHTIGVVAKNGQLDVLEYLFYDPLHQPKCDLMFQAAEHGHMKVVQWLHAMQPHCSDSVIGLRVDSANSVGHGRSGLQGASACYKVAAREPMRWLFDRTELHRTTISKRSSSCWRTGLKAEWFAFRSYHTNLECSRCTSSSVIVEHVDNSVMPSKRIYACRCCNERHAPKHYHFHSLLFRSDRVSVASSRLR